MMQHTPGRENPAQVTHPAVSLPTFLLLTGWIYLSMGVPVSAVIIGFWRLILDPRISQNSTL